MRRSVRRRVCPAGVALAVAAIALVGISQAAFGAPAPQRSHAHSHARAAVGSPACAAPSGPPDPVSATILADTNTDRGAAGLDALSWNPQLYCLALEWSTTLANSGSFEHRDLDAVLGSSAYRSYDTLGENLLRGSAGVGGDAMEQAWMRSPGHRANILQPKYTSMGVAVVVTPGGMVYASENFGG